MKNNKSVVLINRDERQQQCIDKWKQFNGHGCIEAATGFGKTRVALNIISWLQKSHPTIKIFIVVPTTLLQEQWLDNLKEKNIDTTHISVYIINTIIKRNRQCDLLILDECHRYSANTFRAVFQVIKYKMILCLTATFARLDGKEKLIAHYAPVVDRITIQECLANNWVSKFKEYLVVIEPSDLEVYNELTRKFTEHFEFFDFDFHTVFSMLGKKGYLAKQEYARKICSNQAAYKEVLKSVTIHTMEVMRAIQARKKYIYNHPEKIRVAEEILAHRQDCKVVTFSATVKTANKFKEGFVYTGKESKASNRITLDEFAKLPYGALHVCKMADEGLNLPNLEVGIMLGVNSSRTKHIQTRGRVIRYQQGKVAEFFTLVLKDTVEIEWFRKSQGSDEFIIIDETNLIKVLNNEPYETYKEPLKSFVSSI